VRVRTQPGCSWAASSSEGWIAVSSEERRGDGEVEYRVNRNTGSQARSGTITIAGRTHRIEQSGAPSPPPSTSCSYEVAPPERSFGPNGGSSTIRVRTESGCRWSASASATWITIVSGRDGTGNGEVEYRVDRNTGSSARSGSVSVAGHSTRITQNGR
jgi:hypothetical protein